MQKDELKTLVEKTNQKLKEAVTYTDQDLKKSLADIDADYDKKKAAVEGYQDSPVKPQQLARIEQERIKLKQDMIAMYKRERAKATGQS